MSLGVNIFCYKSCLNLLQITLLLVYEVHKTKDNRTFVKLGIVYVCMIWLKLRLKSVDTYKRRRWYFLIEENVQLSVGVNELLNESNVSNKFISEYVFKISLLVDCTQCYLLILIILKNINNVFFYSIRNSKRTSAVDFLTISTRRAFQQNRSPFACKVVQLPFPTRQQRVAGDLSINDQ